jgi:hypothetical protein
MLNKTRCALLMNSLFKNYLQSAHRFIQMDSIGVYLSEALEYLISDYFIF